jgi:peptidoglycan/xylan/chitin deacetylase (PgdA/CDA1 family)
VRLCLAAAFYYTGLVRGVLRWRRRGGRQYLIILNYHRAAGGRLEDHMRYLQRHYRVADLESALRDLYADDRGDGSERGEWRPPLVFTFDDGYLDNYTHALPWAEELRVPISVFPVPAYAESGRCFWWLAPRYLVSLTRAERVVLGDRDYDLSRDADRDALVADMHTSLLEAASLEAREALVGRAEQAMGVSLPTRRGAATDDGALPATWAELMQMRESGWVSFGAHTVHHPVLAQLTDGHELEREVRDSRRELEQRLDQPVRTFAYPIGKFRDIGDRGVRAVREAGYTWALSTIEGVNTSETDPYLLRRLPGDIRVHWLILEAELAGLLGIASRVRARMRRRRL